jgi:hypothetical protein
MRYIKEILVCTCVIIALLAVEFIYIPWGSLDKSSSSSDYRVASSVNVSGVTYKPNLSNTGSVTSADASSGALHNSPSFLPVSSASVTSTGNGIGKTESSTTFRNSESSTTAGTVASVSNSGNSNSSSLAFPSGLIAQNSSSTSRMSGSTFGNESQNGQNEANSVGNGNRSEKSAMDFPPPDPSPIEDVLLPLGILILLFTLYKARTDLAKFFTR